MMVVVVVVVLAIEMSVVAVGLHVRQPVLGDDWRQLWPPPPKR